MIQKLPRLALIIPCYNEVLILEGTIKKLSEVLQRLISSNHIEENSYIVFVDDGSVDRTWNIIERYSALPDSKIKGIKLSRNKGHQYALIAGMESVVDKCDCLISMDADLQQDENILDTFIEKYNQQVEIVFGIRNDRKNDTLLKKITAVSFYNFMSYLGVQIIKNHADFRLLSNKVNKELLKYQESNLFLRGLILELGFKIDYIYFDVKDRHAGESKYTLTKMLSLAWSGISSLSIKPLRLITLIGALAFIFSFFMGGYVLYVSLFTDNAIPGWASTLFPIYFIGGIQVLSIGIVGEYIGKIYLEVKARPRFIIEEKINFDK